MFWRNLTINQTPNTECIDGCKCWWFRFTFGYFQKFFFNLIEKIFLNLILNLSIEKLFKFVDLSISFFDELLNFIVIKIFFVDFMVKGFKHVIRISFVTTLMVQFAWASLFGASENIRMAALLIYTHQDSGVVWYALYIKFNVYGCLTFSRVSSKHILLEIDVANVIAFAEGVVVHYNLNENFGYYLLEYRPSSRLILMIFSNAN